MPENLHLPFFREILPEGLSYGANYLVEFEPDSIWYETSLTLAAHALKQNARTEYHSFMHLPDEVRGSLSKLGLDVQKLEREDTLRIIDTYTITTKLGIPNPIEGLRKASKHIFERYQSVDVKAWGAGVERALPEGFPESERRWLHIDDNIAVLNQYNDEKSVIEVWRTKTLPYARARGLLLLHSAARGVASESFYKEFESFIDGIIDIKTTEEQGNMTNYLRLRAMRGRTVDTQWHRLHAKDNGEIEIQMKHTKYGELGLRRWIKGGEG